MVSLKNKIYVVDDGSVCRALKVLLMSFDFEVETFNSGESFLDAVSNDDPGCLLLDINMPGLSGWVTQRKMVDSGSRRPVIFISAEKPDASLERALTAGAMAFLQKPVNGQTLVDLINATSKEA